MKYTQLRAFHHVALHGGFSRAADALHLTQPAISEQVRSLEADYDVRLFSREKRRVALTEDGAALFEITRRLFDAESQALDLLSESLALRSGRLRIMADSARHVLPVIAPFRARYPKVTLSLREGNSLEVLERLDAYEAEIGVMGEPPDSRKLEVIALGATPIIAFAAHGHPLAGKATVALAELLAHPLVLREQGSKTRALLERRAAERELAVTVGIEADGREAVREIVATGAGVGVVSMAEFSPDPRLAAIALGDADLEMSEFVVCLRERAESRPIRAFMEIARDLPAQLS